jgi:hypothetical protein
MTIIKYFTFLVFFLRVIPAVSQVFLQEGFESGTRPEGWTQEYVHPPVHTEPWRYRNGGHSPNDGNWMVPPGDTDLTRNPSSAHSGTYNAIFFKQGDKNEKTKLITPRLDLAGCSKVELSFYLCQIPWTFGDVTSWDVLRVYYKTSEGGSWVLLREYLDPVYDWELQTVVLPSPSSDYYVAFEAHTRWGYGTCIDDVVIEEKGVQPLWVGQLDFNQNFEQSIPAGSVNVPLMRIDVRILGNTGTAILGNMDFVSLNSDDNDIKPGGLKLFHTTTQVFNTLNQVGSSVDFVSGTASFSGLNYNLPQGRSYLWLTADIRPEAIHGNILDVLVPSGGIMIGDTLYPEADISPPGNRQIFETLYFQDFEGLHGWELTGEFQVDTPDGSGGSPGHPNPQTAFSGSRVLGTDLTGLGANPWHYEPNLTEETAYRATSPVIDAFYYKNLSLFYQRYLNIEVWDEASVQVSRDNGTTWEKIWVSGGYFSDFEWMQINKPLPESFWRTGGLKIRFQLGPTDNQNNYSGWNIDDVFITGEFISKDVGVTEWIGPLSGCGLTSGETVTVRIENFGGEAITEPFTVGYSLNGGTTWTTDTCSESIPVGGSIVYTFPTLADLTSPGLRQVKARTMLAGDQWPENDQVSAQILVVPTITAPYTQQFESDQGYWYASPGSIWEYGTPAGSVINSAYSGSRSWATGLSRKYGDMISDPDRAVFQDNFATETGWTFTGEFERAIPMDLPWFAWSGLYCAGTDLTGRGVYPYRYEKGITPATAHNAITPPIDVTSHNNLRLSFARWLALNPGDSVMIAVSPDNGVTWHTIWKNTEGGIIDDYWQYMEYEIHDSLSGSTHMRIKFSLFHTSSTAEPEYGFNIDNVTLKGDYVNNMPFILNSPCFDLSSLTHPVFEARIWADTEAGVDGANLMYSTDGGSSWHNISNVSGFDDYWNWFTGRHVSALEADGWSGQTGGWTRVRHLLPPEVAGGDNVKFRIDFRADDINNNFDGIALDDIKIYQAPHDAGVIDVLDPVSGCDLGDSRELTLRIRNYGIRDMQPGDALKVGYHISREGELQSAEETIFLATGIPPGSALDVQSAKRFNFSKGGQYHVNVFTIENEPLFYHPEANDLYSGMILVEKPRFTLGPDISTARPDTIVLAPDAGPGIFEYLWQDGSTDPVFHVLEQGTYRVTITNQLGCSETDSIIIYPLITDLGISNIITPVSGCEGATDSRISFTIENYGTDTLAAGEIIPLTLEINSDGFFHDLVLDERFTPGSVIEFTFPGEFDISLPGIYNLGIFTSHPNDVSTSNDGIEKVVHIYGYPAIDLGEDREIFAREYLLDAGAGFMEYLWQDGSTGHELMVDRPGREKYSVTVTSHDGCISSDSVFITLNVADLSIDRVLSPAPVACILSENPPVSVRMLNKGNTTVASGTVIGIEYSLNAGTPVREELILSADLIPGGSIDHVFREPAGLSAGNSYDFLLSIDWAGDVIPENDMIGFTIDAVATTRVDLGPAYQVVTASEYILDAGQEFAAWLWHDGSTLQTYRISTPGINTCSVIVTDHNGCTDSDQVQILLLVPDIGITEIIHPQAACQSENITVAIKNHGNSNISSSTIIKAGLKVNGYPEVLDNVMLTSTFGAGQTIYHTFAGTAGITTPGYYQVTAFTVFAGDLNKSNDTLTSDFEIFVKPHIDLGGGLDTLRGTGRMVLDAPSGYASYLWQDGSTGNSFTVEGPASDLFHVRVTGHNGCSTVDSVYVILYPPGLELVSVTGPASACEPTAPETIGLTVKNSGAWPVAGGETIEFYYRINQGPVVGEPYTLPAELSPEEGLIFNFSNGVMLPGPGTYNIRIWFVYEFDGSVQDNSRVHTTVIHGFPAVSLAPGQDTLYASLPVTLDAGAGFVSYHWNDGSGQQMLDVTVPGKYRVTVVDTHGCAGSDSVVVQTPLGITRPGPTGIEISVYPNPASGFLNVRINSEELIDRLGFELLSPAGSILYRSELTGYGSFYEKLDISRFPAGVYILRIIAGSSHTTRIVVFN